MPICVSSVGALLPEGRHTYLWRKVSALQKELKLISRGVGEV